MELIEDGPVSKHRQLADWLSNRIDAGEFRPDQRLPSEADLVKEFGIARTTARRTFKVLRDKDIAYTVQGRGTFVSPRPPADEADEQEQPADRDD